MISANGSRRGSIRATPLIEIAAGSEPAACPLVTWRECTRQIVDRSLQIVAQMDRRAALDQVLGNVAQLHDKPGNVRRRGRGRYLRRAFAVSRLRQRFDPVDGRSRVLVSALRLRRTYSCRNQRPRAVSMTARRMLS
jgi:hypothetical protein